jgi:ubiquinone/menaquinone biosynthesis C-methylase UbiE
MKKRIESTPKPKRIDPEEKTPTDEYDRMWSEKDVVDFYATHRNSIGEAYESEKHFLKEVLFPGMSICDVGCGAGGFYNILKQYQSDIEYTGVDISDEMIKTAKRLYPEASFHHSNGDTLDYKDGSFDLVISFGVLHLNPEWQKILKECWRIARKNIIFDLRLVRGMVHENTKSYQKLEFDGRKKGPAVVPYIVMNPKDALKIIEGLVPKPNIKAYGYFHQSSHMTVTPYKEVCMTSFCLEKGNDVREILWDVPIGLNEV